MNHPTIGRPQHAGPLETRVVEYGRGAAVSILTEYACVAVLDTIAAREHARQVLAACDRVELINRRAVGAANADAAARLLGLQAKADASAARHTRRAVTA